MLERNERQRGDEHWRNILSRLPNGAITKDDFEFLWTRVESKLKETGEWEKGDFENAIHLYPTNRAVNMENLKKLSKLGEPIVRIEATQLCWSNSISTRDHRA